MIISSNAGSAAEDGTWAENPRCYCAVTNPRIQSEAARRRLTVMRHQRKLTREYQSDDRRCSLTSAALPALGIPRPIARLPSSAEALDKRFHISSALKPGDLVAGWRQGHAQHGTTSAVVGKRWAHSLSRGSIGGLGCIRGSERDALGSR